MPVFFTDSGSLGNLQVTGSALFSGSGNVVTVLGSGSQLLVVSSSRGAVLEVSDYSTITDLFAVSSGSVDIFTVEINKAVSISGSLLVTGSITGSLTGSLFGTASYAINALTASFALNAQGSGFPFTGSAQITGSLGLTGSFLVSGSSGGTTSEVRLTGADSILEITGSRGTGVFGISDSTSSPYIMNVESGSVSILVVRNNKFVGISGSLAVTGSITGSLTGSLFGTASFASVAFTASSAISSSFAFTASSAVNSFNAVTASFALTGGTGGSAFPFSGSARITGSLFVTGGLFQSGSVNINTTTIETAQFVTVSGSNIVTTESTGSFTAAFYQYTIRSASNARSGFVSAVWLNNTITGSMSEFATSDIGNTKGVGLDFQVTTTGLANLIANTTTAGWTVKTMTTLM